MEKHSRFIARVWPVASETEAQERINDMRTRYRDAAHNVYAYSIHNGPVRGGDDGEPQGAAGVPTVNVFQSENIFNVCCVTTRYYGGILLGVGGLVRAYSRAAKAALDNAGVCLMRQWRPFAFSCPYAIFDTVKALTAGCGGVMENTEFGADVTLKVIVPLENGEEYALRIQDASAGAVALALCDPVFRGARVR